MSGGGTLRASRGGMSTPTWCGVGETPAEAAARIARAVAGTTTHAEAARVLRTTVRTIQRWWPQLAAAGAVLPPRVAGGTPERSARRRDRQPAGEV